MSRRSQIIEREGEEFPSRTYRELVIEPAYNQAKVNSIQPMSERHLAHLIRLVEEGLVEQEDAQKIIKALNKIDVHQIKQGSYNPKYEDLFFEVEDFLIKEAGDVAGNLHIARSRNDMGIALYRMNVRKRLLVLVKAASPRIRHRGRRKWCHIIWWTAATCSFSESVY